MIPIIDFQRRSLTGPVMKERDFDKAFGDTIRDILKRYPLIKFNPEQLIVVDDAIGDAVFNAAVDLLVELGLYNRDTQRVITFTREDVLQIVKDLKEGPDEIDFGKGKDKVVIKTRELEAKNPPICFMGAPGITSTEELYVPYTQSFLQEELCEGYGGMAMLPSYNGYEKKAGEPGEIYCTLAEMKMTREVMERLGKPDIYTGPTNATSPAAILALAYPGGLERHNSPVACHLHAEQKLDWERLMITIALELRGMIPFTSGAPIIGIYCRGPEDAAVTLLANVLGNLSYSHGRLAQIGVADLRGNSSTKDIFWCYSAVARAVVRHFRIPVGGWGNSLAGACTEMAFYEKAAQTAAMVASGAGWLWYAGCRIGLGDNVTSGLESRMIAEVSHAVAGMKSAKANEVVKNIYSLYADQLSAPPQGKTFGEIYDVKKVQPTAEYMEVYKRAKDNLAKAGIPFKK